MRLSIAVLTVLTMLDSSVGVAQAGVTTFTNEADFLTAIANEILLDTESASGSKRTTVLAPRSWPSRCRVGMQTTLQGQQTSRRRVDSPIAGRATIRRLWLAAGARR